MNRLANGLFLVGFFTGLVGSLMAIGLVLITRGPAEGLIFPLIVLAVLLYLLLPYQRRREQQRKQTVQIKG